MPFKRTVTFIPPDVSKATTLEEVKAIVQSFLSDLCDKLNRELTNIERTT